MNGVNFIIPTATNEYVSATPFFFNLEFNRLMSC